MGTLFSLSGLFSLIASRVFTSSVSIYTLSDDFFNFLYILLQSSFNFTGISGVFTEKFELDKVLTFVITCNSTCTENQSSFSFPCTMYTFSGQSTHVLLPDSLVNVSLSAARTPALLQTSLSS